MYFTFFPGEITVKTSSGMKLTIRGSEVFAGKLKKAYEMEEMIKPIGRSKKEAK